MKKKATFFSLAIKKSNFFFSRNHQKQGTSALGVSPFQQKGFRFLSPNFWSSETVEIRTKIQGFVFSLKNNLIIIIFFILHGSYKVENFFTTISFTISNNIMAFFL